METIIRLLDELDDVVATTAFRIRRALTRTPRERRHRPRLGPHAAAPARLAELSLQRQVS